MRTMRHTSPCADGSVRGHPSHPSQVLPVLWFYPSVTTTTFLSTTCIIHSGTFFGALTGTQESYQSTSSTSSSPVCNRCKVAPYPKLWMYIAVLMDGSSVSCGSESWLQDYWEISDSSSRDLVVCSIRELQTLQRTFNRFKVNWCSLPDHYSYCIWLMKLRGQRYI
jgi:hypothetical protein